MQDQILAVLLSKIEDGTFGPGEQLPTEKQIAESLGVSLAPVRVAMKQLELSGYVERTQGRGTFVIDRPVRYELRLMSSTTDSLRRAGVPFSVEVVDQSVSVPPADIASRIALRPDDLAFHLVRVVTVRSRAAILLESWVPRPLMGEVIDDEIFDRGGSLYGVLAKNGVVQARATGSVSIHYASVWEADLMSIAFGAPLLALSSLNYDAAERPIDFSRSLYEPAQFSLDLDHVRESGTP